MTPYFIAGIAFTAVLIVVLVWIVATEKNKVYGLAAGTSSKSGVTAMRPTHVKSESW